MLDTLDLATLDTVLSDAVDAARGAGGRSPAT